MDAVRRAAGILFYLLGSIVIVLIVLVQRGTLGEGAVTLLNVLDLPLIFLASVFGGMSLYVSIVKDKRSFPVLLLIAVPVGVAIITFAWINFMAPFAEV